MEIFISGMIFILGLCLGSFVNMLEFRTAVGYGIIKYKRADTRHSGQARVRPYKKNRSFCDECGKQLNWFENIPVISWLIQKGKTRCCDKKLPISYPIVELMMGFLFLGYSLKFNIFDQNLWVWILGLIIITFIVFSGVFDFRYMILPDFSTVILIISSIILILVNQDFGSLGKFLFTAIGVSGFFLLLHLTTKGKGMGMGDVKLGLFMGLLLGIKGSITALYIAFIVGALVGVIGIFLKKIKMKTEVPFGPFLILGTFIAWWWGKDIWGFVLRLY